MILIFQFRKEVNNLFGISLLKAVHDDTDDSILKGVNDLVIKKKKVSSKNSYSANTFMHVAPTFIRIPHPDLYWCPFELNPYFQDLNDGLNSPYPSSLLDYGTPALGISGRYLSMNYFEIIMKI